MNINNLTTNTPLTNILKCPIKQISLLKSRTVLKEVTSPEYACFNSFLLMTCIII